MKVLVCGGRFFRDRIVLERELDAIHAATPISMVIAGGQRGADTLAEGWAVARGIQPRVVPANWRAFRAMAGPLRNRAMLDLAPDLVVAFPGGSGTAHMRKIAREAGVPIHVVGVSA